MVPRRSIMYPLLEELGALSPPATPIRRRSSISRVAELADAADNESKHLQHRVEKNQPQAEKQKSLSLGLVPKMSSPQIADAVSRCLKLFLENKINIKNAFSLEVIDFMTCMIMKRDDNMSNVQVASMSLDVCTKIYGYRVDGVHTDVLKMIGASDKQEKDGRWENRVGTKNSDAGDGNDVDGEPTRKAKKKKKFKQRILANAKSLRAPLKLISPALMMIGKSDVQNTDMPYQAILPVHANSDLYLHPYVDIILDMANPNAEVNNAPVDSRGLATWTCVHRSRTSSSSVGLRRRSRISL